MPKEGSQAKRGRLHRGVYLLPSLFTIGNMFLGFYAIIIGLRGEYQLAILLVFLAAFVDSLDGRLARVTQTESDFGREYDSLADLLTFGLTPALLIYTWGLDQLGRIGWMIPLLYVVCTATRLARFNVQTKPGDKRFFVGLPAPAAAGATGSLLFFAVSFGDGYEAIVRPALLVTLAVVGLLMVSTFRYYSFKELDPRRRWSFRIVVPIVGTLLLVLLHPPAFFLTVSGSYALSGPTTWLKGQLTRRPQSASDPNSMDAEPDPTSHT